MAEVYAQQNLIQVLSEIAQKRGVGVETKLHVYQLYSFFLVTARKYDKKKKENAIN